MKKLILIVLVLLLLAGAAAGGYVFFFAKPSEAAAEAAPSPPQPGEFVALDPIALPVLRDGAVRAQVMLGITLELAAERRFEDVRPSLVRLRDAFLTELGGLLALDWPGGAVLDLDIARRRLLDRCRRLLGPDMVAGLFFQRVQERTL